MSQFVGHEVSKLYASVRPSVTPALVDHVLGWLRRSIDEAKWSLVVDVGCGAGKTTVQFADRLPAGVQLLAFDNSRTQIERAQADFGRPNVRYTECDCGVDVPVPNKSVDLITVIQAAHWFDMRNLCRTAKLKLKPGGVLALIFYPLPQIDCVSLGGQSKERVDAAIKWLNDELQTEGCWASQRLLVTPDEYRSIEMPFEEVERVRDAADFNYRSSTNLEGFFRFFESFSGVRAYRERQQQLGLPPTIMEQFTERVKKEFGKPGDASSSEKVNMVFPYQLVLGRNKIV